MTEQEVADMVMETLGFAIEPKIVEVEAGRALNEVEIELDDGSRWSLTVTRLDD